MLGQPKESSRSDIEAPQIGQPSPSTFLAESFIAAVPDVELTESLREAAAAEVGTEDAEVPPEEPSDPPSEESVAAREPPPQ